MKCLVNYYCWTTGTWNSRRRLIWCYLTERLTFRHIRPCWDWAAQHNSTSRRGSPDTLMSFSRRSYARILFFFGDPWQEEEGTHCDLFLTASGRKEEDDSRGRPDDKSFVSYLKSVTSWHRKNHFSKAGCENSNQMWMLFVKNWFWNTRHLTMELEEIGR